MRKQTEQQLNAWGVPRHLAGYGYLLDAADFIAQGVPVGLELLSHIAQANCRTPGQVRRALAKVAVTLARSPASPVPSGSGPFTPWDLLLLLFPTAAPTTK